jgi:hypothetical protein
MALAQEPHVLTSEEKLAVWHARVKQLEAERLAAQAREALTSAAEEAKKAFAVCGDNAVLKEDKNDLVCVISKIEKNR